MGTKTVGAITVLEFAVECAKRGGIISEPFGDDAPYDLIIESPNNKLFRVQVKTANQLEENIYQLNSQPRHPVQGKNGKKSSEVIKYKIGTVDVLVSKLMDDWYFFEKLHDLPAVIRIDLTKKGKRSHCKSLWSAIDM